MGRRHRIWSDLCGEEDNGIPDYSMDLGDEGTAVTFRVGERPADLTSSANC